MVKKTINEIEGKVNNVRIEVKIQEEEIEYRNTGRKIGATFVGYKLESGGMTIYVNIYDPEWVEEGPLLFALAHEVGHAIYRADQEIRYNFGCNSYNNSYKMPGEMWEYVVENYGPESWDEELFADGFASWITGITRWGSDVKKPGVEPGIEGLEKWIK